MIKAMKAFKKWSGIVKDEGGCELNQDGSQTETNHQQFLVQQLRLKFRQNFLKFSIFS